MTDLPPPQINLGHSPMIIRRYKIAPTGCENVSNLPARAAAALC